MSGAFNIDIEVGSSGGGLKIYCASLTDLWVAQQDYNGLKAFYDKLAAEDSVSQGQVQIGSCPKQNDTSAIEAFLSQLGCTAGILRLKIFQDFLKVPMSVREGLAYAKHKPFGKTIKESWLSRHPRYIRRGANKKWIRLTQDERGASLVSYENDHSTSIPHSALKISQKTEMKVLKEIQHAFVLKSGKRQWVLQAANVKDFNSWFSQLKTTLTKSGAKVDDSNLGAQPTSPKNNAYKAKGPVSNDVKVLQTENKTLKDELELWKKKYKELEKQLDTEEEKEDVDQGSDSAVRKQLIKEFTKEKDDLIREYEIQHENLRTEIEDLKKQLETKVATENGKSGLQGLFGAGFQSEEELKAEIDIEKKQLDALTDEEKATIKFIHKHLHRHGHKHIHHHRHVHIHDNTKKPAETFTNTHTVSHTITHTNTQFQIKKASFF